MEINPKRKKFEIQVSLVGERIDRALSSIPEIGTRSRADHLISSNLVWVNGSTPKNSYKLKKEDVVEFQIPDQKSSELVPLDLKLEILFEDQDVIVINKPAGLVIHPAAGHENDTLVNALIHHTKDLSMKFGEQRPGIVHRLDRDTSGVLVVAKNDFSHENLVHQFKNRSIHRVYLAACIGVPTVKEGKISSFLARHPTDRKRFASLTDPHKKIIRDHKYQANIGKWSITNFKCLSATTSGLSYLQLKLETGRTHQIRVHLSEMGLPIIGDELYGAKRKINKISSTKDRDLVKLFPRFALHATELGFFHPRTNKSLFFKVDWPNDLKFLLTDLRLIK